MAKKQAEKAAAFPAAEFRKLLADAAQRSEDGTFRNGDAAALKAMVTVATPRDIIARVQAVGAVDAGFNLAIAEAKKKVADAEKELGVLTAQRRWVRDFIRDAMVKSGRISLKMPGLSMYLTDGRESVVVTDIEVVPEEFIRTKREVDKNAVMDAVKARGVVPTGVEVKRGEPVLTVKFQ
jgi:phage host-nuclease inhibitor protein Gam